MKRIIYDIVKDSDLPHDNNVSPLAVPGLANRARLDGQRVRLLSVQNTTYTIYTIKFFQGVILVVSPFHQMIPLYLPCWLFI